MTRIVGAIERCHARTLSCVDAVESSGSASGIFFVDFGTPMRRKARKADHKRRGRVARRLPIRLELRLAESFACVGENVREIAFGFGAQPNAPASFRQVPFLAETRRSVSCRDARRARLSPRIP